MTGSLRSRLFSLVTSRLQAGRKTVLTGFIAMSLTLIAADLRAQQKPDLASLSVDDLMNVEVTSVSRKEQKLSDTAAAVFVITQDDIQRSGATSIPEVLRIVPGLDVARISGNLWAISARGFNGRFANKLLVMIDGRSVYTPLFSGVNWDVQDTLLEDVERIEVIRGPGGTLWGANAVNGIINIITKHAIETQGTLVTAGAGAAEGLSAAARQGGAFGQNGYYRVYGKSFDRPASIEGVNATHDAWSMGRAGFRADWASRRGDDFTLEGDIYRGAAAALDGFDAANLLADRATTTRLSGRNLQFRWAAVQSSRSETTLQAFYDYGARTQNGLALSRHTFDIDFEHHLKMGSRNDAVWGAGYRTSSDRAGGTDMTLVRDSNVASIASAFVQDEMQVTRRLRLTAGTKLEYDSSVGLKLQPTVRLLFKASERQTIWAAATSAVRTPSEMELYGRLNAAVFPDGSGKLGLLVITGNPDLEAERVVSYEAGYRLQVAANVAFDATAFHNRMYDLVGTAAGRPFRSAAGRTIIPLNFSNSVYGDANGAELFLTDAVTAKWNLALGYAYFESDAQTGDATTPRHQMQLRSSNQLTSRLDLDSAVYYVGRIGIDVPSYLRLDEQLTWHAGRRWSLSVSGQNLLRARHSEFVGTTGQNETATPAQRMVNGKITWRF